MGFDVTERPVFEVTRDIAGAWQRNGAAADVAIGGLPFLLAITDATPYTRQTVQWKRDQIDISPEAGEHTLSQWWVRDQDGFHRGAGAVYYEPGSDQSTRFRFNRSAGVDVWGDGEVRLLKAMQVRRAGATASYAVAGSAGGADVIWHVVDGTLRRDDLTTETAYTSTPTPATAPVIGGGVILVGSTAGILSGSLTGSSLSTLWSTGTGVLVRPWWAKSRIIAARGAALWDLTPTGGNIDSTTPLWTHPTPTWTWTTVAESPTAIMAAGHDGTNSAIYKFTLVTPTSGTTPILGPAIEVAALPPGELIYSMRQYLGSFLGLGTSRGVRIAQIDAEGNLAYGPLTIETTQPVRDLAAADRFVYAAVQADIDGDSGCARIDLGEEIPNERGATTLRYAWAYDAALSDASQVNSVALVGTTGRVVLAGATGVSVQSATEYVDAGYLTSGRIRFATTEDKLFRRARVRIAALPGDTSIALATVANGVTSPVLSMSGDVDSGADIGLSTVAQTRLPYMSVHLTLNASTDRLATPVLDSWQVKASPLPIIQREVTFPLLVADLEQDRHGVRAGYPGSAYDRLRALEELEQSKSVVTVQDLGTGESFAGLINVIRFLRDTPPGRRAPNFGGRVLVQVTKL